MHYCYYDSPIGKLMLSSEKGSLTGLWMAGQKYYAETLSADAQEQQDFTLTQAANWLDRYFAGAQPEIRELSLAPEGSAFRQKVWDILCRIPYGAVTTYGEIAKTIAASEGRETWSSQAVGGAVGHNPISIIIPCHRVVGTDGSLTGYSGGIEKKTWLLEFEGVDMSGLFAPKQGTAL